ncbi:tripartite tricarboxylate transporter substrate binding protein [Sabulicella glaciei]|uniref:Tripartite tricarboxylate transporter substrate binding protein n=1 Tax=Sabulicella glaciei TaxID=2984948 RepID=A0ABT3NSN5_9PROT|nr:tripartite tricarboxylate transporter substrate binding protein [Roseococcus sp. MDT2-1-1]MCW8085176.1 tripartite tricarboxylate transporter substrate binding protein [Roseococcus sp. MDT2-1-1]
MLRRALLALPFLALPAAAQEWRPERPMTIVLPYAPGSAADGYSRAMGEHFTRVLGQPVTVINRDGGSGTVGMRVVAQAAPDGLTLGITPMTPVVVQPHMVRNLGIGPDSFAPVCGIAENILGVVVREDSPFRSLTDLVEEAKRRPLSYGSPGPNSLPFLGVWRVQRSAGGSFEHIPFRGDPPSMTETLAGRLDFSAVVVASASGQIASGRMRLIGVFSDRRHPDFPDVPTAQEQGLDAVQLSFVGMYAPRGTPEPTLQVLERECRNAMETDTFRQVARQLNVVAGFRSREEFSAMVRDEYASFGTILPQLGVRPE